MTELISPNTSQNNNNDFNQKQKKITFFDKFFLVTTSAGFLGGLIFCFIPGSVPLVPAIFFGSGISSLVYYFMGGIKQDTTVTIGIVKLGGTLASLIGTIWILNAVFERQFDIALASNPELDKILAIDKENGEFIELKINVKNHLPKRIEKVITRPSESTLEQIKQKCRNNQAFCKEPDIPVIFKKNTSLEKREARVCSNQTKFYGYPLWAQNSITGNSSVIAVSSVNPHCRDSLNNPMLVEIGTEAANDILGKQETTKGVVTLHPLQSLPL